jgi:hypothetical protein
MANLYESISRKWATSQKVEVAAVFYLRIRLPHNLDFRLDLVL